MKCSARRDGFTLRGLRRFRGFTLVEVLAVVVIASAASAVLLTGLTNADRHASLLEALSRWQDMDQRGRLFAQTEGRAMLLRIDHEAQVLSLNPADIDDDDESAALSRFELPSDLSLTFVDGRQKPIQQIEIDRLGRGVDYTANFATDSGVIHRQVCGLSGWVIEQDEFP